MAFNPRRVELMPSFICPPLAEVMVIGAMNQQASKGLGVLQGFEQQGGRLNRRFPIAEGQGSRPVHVIELRQFLAFAMLGNTSHQVEVHGQLLASGLQGVDHLGLIDDGLGVGGNRGCGYSLPGQRLDPELAGFPGTRNQDLPAVPLYPSIQLRGEAPQLQ
jgi:hypothetical protein